MAIPRRAWLKIGKVSREKFPARVREITADDPLLRPLVKPLLSIIAVMTEKIATLANQVMDQMHREPVCRRLTTVPGVVVPHHPLAPRATIDRPERLGKLRDVGAHLGLTPLRYQSGETDVRGRQVIQRLSRARGHRRGYAAEVRMMLGAGPRYGTLR